MHSGTRTDAVTFLFTDIEGSTQLWEQEPERMPSTLAAHDALARGAVERHRGKVVKTTGDGIYAVFDDALDALAATLDLQQALADTVATCGIPLHLRCGLHVGVAERRDSDFFGIPVNRAARIMSAAHGGQVLLSQAVVDCVREILPAAVSLRDLGNVRLKDLATPEHVYQVVHPQLRQEFPALRSLESTPNNLPQQVSSFIGRERELADLGKLLGDTRLLTLIGHGGIGKTRLSLQAAADMMDNFADGVWFVELAPLTDARLVPQAVASVLGVKEEAGRPVQEALLKHVKDRQMLLILDNCEHLVQACADLVKPMLQAGPQLKILASSREHLHLTGERTYEVPSLGVPKESDAVDALTRFEAVRLFIDRAVAAQSTFQLNQENAYAVARICHRLDGIPLALELAAARIRALSVQKIAERLGDRFQLLTGGDKTALPRQQTLRALINWSYDLLVEPEQTLFRRLAVFSGGWTLEAAEAIGIGGDIETSDVLDLLTRLVEKSLVARDATGDRYRLLETVRQYGQERLDASGEGAAVSDRHLGFYLALVERARAELAGSQQVTWLARLDLERENLLSAHAWCDRAHDEAERGLRLIVAVQLYWLGRGLLELGYRVTVEGLARRGANECGLVRCRALFAAGQLGYFSGRYEQAKGHLTENVVLLRELGDKPRIAATLVMLGAVCIGQGDLTAARRHLDESLALARELADPPRLVEALNALAELHRAEEDLDAAEPLYGESLVLAREVGDSENIAIGLQNLARVAISRGSADRARAMLLEMLAIVDEIGSKRAGRSVLEVSAAFAAFVGEFQRAARLYGATQAQLEQTGYHRDPADEAFLAPLIARARAALGAAAFTAAETAGSALDYDDGLAETRAWLQSRS